MPNEEFKITPVSDKDPRKRPKLLMRFGESPAKMVVKALPSSRLFDECRGQDWLFRESLSETGVKIGVLALQGGYEAHITHLKKLSVSTCEVRTKEDLSHCDGLILPGGESTTINHHLNQNGLKEALVHFASCKPLFGTCAGIIIMAQQKILPIEIERNAYGRQSASFFTSLVVNFPHMHVPQKYLSIFIRAPQILSINDCKTIVLSLHNHRPVFIQHGYHLGATFHPELTNDLSFHKYFVDLCLNRKAML